MAGNPFAPRQFRQHVGRPQTVPREAERGNGTTGPPLSPAIRALLPSFAAMTVSVASSPIFFNIASSPLREQRGDIGRRRSTPLRDSIVAARRVRMPSSERDSAIAVNCLGV